MCDLIKLSTTVTIAPCWLWLRGYMQPLSYVELVETSRWIEGSRRFITTIDFCVA